MKFQRIVPGIVLGGFLLAGTCTVLADDTKIPDFSSTPRSQVPVQYTWRIEDLYPSVEAWTGEKERVVRLIGQVDKMSADWTTTPQKFLGLYRLIDSIGVLSSRLMSYASNQSNMELSNNLYRKMQGELQSIFTDYSARLAFVNDDILKMNSKVLQGYFVGEPRLGEYRFRVDQVVRAREHVLPKDEQRIVSLTGLFAGAPEQAAGVLNNVDVPAPEVTLSDGARVTLNFAGYMRYRGAKNAADRSLVMRTFWAHRKQFENTLAVLQDGAIKQHLFTAQVQKYSGCLQARLFDDNIDTTVYHNLIAVVRQNLGALHHYLRVRRQLLGLDTLRYDDVYASAVRSVNREFTYDEARSIITASLQPLGSEYGVTLKKGFDDRWIDIYPNKDKEQGAYSGGVYGVHPFIKMNYNGNYDAVSTLAHELGHALHSSFADRTQTYGNAGNTTFLAEIASTFNEHMLMDQLLKTGKDDMFKLFLLDRYLDGMRGTIFRQTLFAEFELAIHRHVEEGKTLTPDWMSETYLSLTRTYYGHDAGVMRVDDYIQNEWSIIPHFYLNFYVFQYSTGMIASLALSDRVLKGTAVDRDRYLGMLKAGGSAYPLDILKNAGVDMTSTAPGVAALKRFDALVGEMETIMGRLKQQGKI
jgi:oligoendopeptidase F